MGVEVNSKKTKTITMAEFRRTKFEQLKKLLDEYDAIFVLCLDLPPIKVTWAQLQ